MNTGFFILLIAIVLQLVNAACTVDSYTNLPPAPVFPSSTLSSTLTPTPSTRDPLTQDHWSETAKLASYRPPYRVPSSNPSQTNCPHTQLGLKNWHDPAIWPGSKVPANGANVNLPANTAVLISSCSIDPSFVFGVINIPATSKLIFGDAPISIKAVGFNVTGSLLAGSQTCRLRNKITITLYGSRGAQALPAPAWIKGISVYGTIDLHGALYYPTWTRLAMTAKAGSSYIFVQDRINWQPGQRIVVTTTEVKDSRDFNRNEERNIVAVFKTTLGANVSAIQLDSPLSFYHYGGREYQAEVSLLSRNILFQGDATNSAPTDTVNAVCKDVNDGSTFPCENSYLTGFGAHIAVNGSAAQGRFSGVELYRVGQTNVLGRYPIHYHMLGNIAAANYQTAFVQDSSVHDSYFRCYAIHGTSGARLTENTAYNAIGHCYFLEDGVEENNIITYNQAAHVHALGPYVNPSIAANGDSWYAQYLSYYNSTSNMILPSDMAAGAFYITNAYNDIIGNAASGGWSGFAMPSLKLPVKLHASVTNMSPANRPFRSAFRGNSAHSTGFWWKTAGGIYVGGELKQYSNGVLTYTSGRSLNRDTCTNATVGTPSGPSTCSPVNYLWMRFEDNKVFLANRGMQNWGQRSEIIRFELHDVGLSMNVFGRVWIDQMLMECRTPTNRPTYLNGCPAAPAEYASLRWGVCNVRDYMWFNQFGGFQWYDVGQLHIVTNSKFKNCRADWNRCIYGPSKGVCSDHAVFTSLTHSDEFVPSLMQITSGIKYENVTELWQYSTELSQPMGVTVSGRLQSWYDADGSASQLGVRAMIGSARANTWWKYNSGCTLYKDAYRCALTPKDSSASLVLKYAQLPAYGTSVGVCVNGNNDGTKKCPLIAKASHFGSTNETAGLDVAVNAKITGPIIASKGGWFIRFKTGTPSKLTITSVQVEQDDPLILAFPYPTGTKFQIYYSPSSCSPSWGVCRHNYTQVNSLAEVKSHFGDAYYFSNQILYMRVVTAGSYFGSKGTDVQFWTPYPPPTTAFSRGGHTLFSPAGSSIQIESSCSSSYCAIPSVAIPPASPL